MEATRLRLDEVVDVREEQGRIVIEPVRQKTYGLEDLLKGITSKNLHDFAHRSGKRPKVRGELVHTKQLHEHRHGKVDPVAERPDVVRAPPVAVDDAIGRLVIDDFIGAEEAREKNGSQRDGDQEQAGEHHPVSCVPAWTRASLAHAYPSAHGRNDALNRIFNPGHGADFRKPASYELLHPRAVAQDPYPGRHTNLSTGSDLPEASR